MKQGYRSGRAVGRAEVGLSRQGADRFARSWADSRFAVSLQYVAAGHPPPIIVPKDAAPSICETTGPPIGILPEPDYEDRTIDLAAGDRKIEGTLNNLDPRKPPVLGWLPRNNFLNIMLGRWRAKLQK